MRRARAPWAVWAVLLVLGTALPHGRAEDVHVLAFDSFADAPLVSDDEAFSVHPSPVLEPLMRESRALSLVRDTPDGKLAPDERGLAFLRSPALADRALRIIGVVGQARTGKSFFLNSLLGEARTFEVSSGDEGFTKGLWIHQIETPEMMPGGGEVTDAATILIDSEGLGAPGGSKVYDTKMVALTAMLSSTTFYNNMRKVNKMDVEFLGDVVLFDEIFRSMADEPLLASSIVWLVQSYSSRDECADYPLRFLRKLGDEADDEFQMHDRVIDYVKQRSKESKIFCLPYPKTEPYVPERDLDKLEFAQLDTDYRSKLEAVREYLAEIPEKQGLHGGGITGRELAELVERLVPALNDIGSAAKALVAMRAEATRANVSDVALSLLQSAEAEVSDCSRLPPSLTAVTRVCEGVAEQALKLFETALIGDAHMMENQRERSRLRESLHWMTEASLTRIRAKWVSCRPDKVLLVFRDYYLMVYIVQADVMVRALVGHRLGWSSLSRMLLVLLNWPREVAVAAGLLNLVPSSVICQHLETMGSGVLQMSAQGCGEGMAMLGMGLRGMVDIWIDVVSPVCERASSCLQALVMTNAGGATMLAITIIFVRFAPIRTVAKLLPSMVLCLAMLSVWPEPSGGSIGPVRQGSDEQASLVMQPGQHSLLMQPAPGQGAARELDEDMWYGVVVSILLALSLVDVAMWAYGGFSGGHKAQAPMLASSDASDKAPRMSGHGAPGAAHQHPSEHGTEEGSHLQQWLCQQAGRSDSTRQPGYSPILQQHQIRPRRRLSGQMRRGHGAEGAQGDCMDVSVGDEQGLSRACTWLSSDNLNDFLAHDQGKLHAILFTGRQKQPLLLAQAAHIFKGRVVFACAHTQHIKVCTQTQHIQVSLRLPAAPPCVCGYVAAVLHGV